jgi:alpha-ketoglutarate-dependent taurine dioxygenase
MSSGMESRACNEHNGTISGVAMKQDLLTATSLQPKIGAEIHIDIDILLSAAAAPQIRNMLVERGVVCFRDLHLTDSQQIQVARTLGTLSDEAPDGIVKVSTNQSLNPNRKLADYQRSSYYWHIDGFGRDVPYLATLLGPRGLPECGGQTEISNVYAAYEDLAETDKTCIEGLQVVHSFETLMRVVTPWPTYEELTEWQRQPSKRHSLVWTHRSGRKSLVLGASASHIVGMGLEEGRALLCRLCEWATQPQYVYRHEWRLGDLVIWDNTGTLHRALPYPPGSDRIMHKTTLFGEEPFS